MKVIVLLLLLAIATTTTSSAVAISSVNPAIDTQLSTDQDSTPKNVRVPRSSDGFDVDEMPKVKLTRGKFADEKMNVNGVKRDSGGVMTIVLKFIKELLSHFNINFEM